MNKNGIIPKRGAIHTASTQKSLISYTQKYLSIRDKPRAIFVVPPEI